MKIGGANGINSIAQPLMAGKAMDSREKNLQAQIQKKQEELQKLAENKDMDVEEKMKKRQEIQQEINDLNMQLRSYQIEQRKERQNKGNAIDEMLGSNRQVSPKSKKEQSNRMSQTSMKALISADASMKLADVQGSVATQAEGRANILKSEIQQDGGRGGATEAKEKELAETEQKAVKAAAMQMDTLGKTNEELKEASKADSENSKSENDKMKKNGTKKDKIENNKTERNKTENNKMEQNESQKDDVIRIIENQNEEDYINMRRNQISVDVRL